MVALGELPEGTVEDEDADVDWLGEEGVDTVPDEPRAFWEGRVRVYRSC